MTDTPSGSSPDSELPSDLRSVLLRQLDIAWSLTDYHLTTLETDECLWRPAPAGPHVHRVGEREWRADWPEHEGYDLGPPSIAWLTWHLGFWWSMVLNHSFGDATLTREQVLWPGDAAAMRDWIVRLHSEWRTAIEELSDEELHSTTRSRWPARDRSFADIVSWANLELMKNASEIGYGRFLHGVKGEAVGL